MTDLKIPIVRYHVQRRDDGLFLCFDRHAGDDDSAVFWRRWGDPFICDFEQGHGAAMALMAPAIRCDADIRVSVDDELVSSH